MLESPPLYWMRVDDADSNTPLNPILCIYGTKAKERNSWVCCLQKCLTIPNSFRPPKVVHLDWFFGIEASPINRELTQPGGWKTQEERMTKKMWRETVHSQS